MPHTCCHKANSLNELALRTINHGPDFKEKQVLFWKIAFKYVHLKSTKYENFNI